MPQQQPNATPKARLAGMTIIYFSLPLMMVLFGAIAFYLNYSREHEPAWDAQLAQLLRYGLIVLTPAGVLAAYYINKQRLAAIDHKAPLGEKLIRLQETILVSSACLEVPGLGGAVATMQTMDNSFLLFTAVMVVVFLFWRPTAEKVAEDLQLSMQERSELGK